MKIGQEVLWLPPLQWGLGHVVEPPFLSSRKMGLNQNVLESPSCSDRIFWHSNPDSVLLS